MHQKTVQVFTEKKPHTGGPTHFKLVLFKGQMYFNFEAYRQNVFPLWKHFSLLKVSLFFFQFTDEDGQNKVGTLSRGEEKGKHQNWRQGSPKQANKLHNQNEIALCLAQSKLNSWKINPWNKNGTYVMKNKF